MRVKRVHPEKVSAWDNEQKKKEKKRGKRMERDRDDFSKTEEEEGGGGGEKNTSKKARITDASTKDLSSSPPQDTNVPNHAPVTEDADAPVQESVSLSFLVDECARVKQELATVIQRQEEQHLAHETSLEEIARANDELRTKNLQQEESLVRVQGEKMGALEAESQAALDAQVCRAQLEEERHLRQNSEVQYNDAHRGWEEARLALEAVTSDGQLLISREEWDQLQQQSQRAIFMDAAWTSLMAALNTIEQTMIQNDAYVEERFHICRNLTKDIQTLLQQFTMDTGATDQEAPMHTGLETVVNVIPPTPTL